MNWNLRKWNVCVDIGKPNIAAEGKAKHHTHTHTYGRRNARVQNAWPVRSLCILWPRQRTPLAHTRNLHPLCVAAGYYACTSTSKSTSIYWCWVLATLLPYYPLPSRPATPKCIYIHVWGVFGVVRVRKRFKRLCYLPYTLISDLHTINFWFSTLSALYLGDTTAGWTFINKPENFYQNFKQSRAKVKHFRHSSHNFTNLIYFYVISRVNL